jgi:hypothetical protein
MAGSRCDAQAMPTASGPGAYLAGGVAYSHFQTDYGRHVVAGITGYVDANVTWRFGVEGEARYLNYHSLNGDSYNDISEITYLAGPRISFHPRVVRPYVKFLVGRGTFEFPNGYAQGRYFAMAPGAGVDMELGSRINLRLVDFEYQKWPNFVLPSYNAGTLSPYGFSFGVSYKFFNGATWIK